MVLRPKNVSMDLLGIFGISVSFAGCCCFSFYGRGMALSGAGEKAKRKPLPLGEVAPKVTERARMLPEIHRHSDSIALTKSLLIAAQRL